MAWKSEKWLEEVFPGKDRVYQEYRNLPRRELAIVAAAVLDSALGDLLSRRLLDVASECEEFLGLNEDGRAPCGSFGSRIQLALLVGVITDNDAKILRIVKNLRNKLAHRVKVDYNTTTVLPLVYKLHDQLLSQSNILIEKGFIQGPKHDMKLLPDFIKSSPEVGAAIVLATLTVYQPYLYRVSQYMKRIDVLAVTERV